MWTATESLPWSTLAALAPRPGAVQSALAHALVEVLTGALTALAAATPKLATVGIAFCAMGMMVSGRPHVWGSRAAMLFLGGAAIRVIW